MQRQRGPSSQAAVGQQGREVWSCTQDEIPRKTSFHSESRFPTVSASTPPQTRRFTEHHTKTPTTGTSSDHRIEQYVARALEEKEEEVEKLRQSLAVATSRNDDLGKRKEVLLKKVNDLRNELATQKSRYENTITSLAAQVNQWKAACAEKSEELEDALSWVRELQLEVSNPTAQSTESQSHYETQSQELVSLSRQLQTMASSNEEKDREIASLTAGRNREESANATKAEQIAKLQQELSISRSHLAEFQARWKAQSDELARLQSKPKITASPNEKNERKIAALTGEVAELKRINALGDERITATSKQVKDLQRELSKSNSRVAKLRHDNDMQFTELGYLRNRLKATEENQAAYVTSLTARLEKWKASYNTKVEELVAMHKKLDELYRRPESAQSQRELTSQLKRAQESDAARTAELNDARVEIKRLHRELDASSSRIAQSQDTTTAADYRAKLTELTSQVRQWKRSHDATEEEYKAAREKIQQLQRELDASSSRITQLQQQSDTQSAQLQLFREQFPGISDATAETGKWSTVRARIMAEAKDYATVIRLTTEVDKWISARPGYEDLRRKLITLKEIYVNAPRIKQIFQSESMPVKKRYEEETILMKRRYEEEVILMKKRYEEASKTLKAALADSQSQLRDVQRVVATADMYADETLIHMLKKLNAEIQQNTTLMAESIAEQSQRVVSRKVTKAVKENVSRSIGQTLAECLTSMERDEAPLYLSIAFQAYFSYYLCQLIASWTIEEGNNDFINKIYEQLREAGKKSSPGCYRHFCLR